MQQRMQFISEMEKKEKPFKHLCTEFGISEKTGYKWKKRYLENGLSGLFDQSRQPKNSPDKLNEDVITSIVNLKISHPYWGPKKIKILYENIHGDSPSISSINRILSKCSLVNKKRKRPIKITTDPFHRLIKPEAPNDVWCIDFKGWWKCGNEVIEPFTCIDLYSRKILEIQLVNSRKADIVKMIMTELFKKYGLPKIVKSDNGLPFASNSAALKLTTLSAWWMSLGIAPDRIKPGNPGQNGALERMHGVMSREVENNVIGGVIENQAVLNAWKDEYNSIRPNEALGMKTPDDVYVKSEREYEGDPEELEYPLGFYSRKVSMDGYVRIRSVPVFISSALRGLNIGLLPLDEKNYSIFLGEFPLGEINTETVCYAPIKEL